LWRDVDFHGTFVDGWIPDEQLHVVAIKSIAFSHINSNVIFGPQTSSVFLKMFPFNWNFERKKNKN